MPCTTLPHLFTPRPPLLLPGPSRDQRTAFCAQYYAAVRLLSVASDPACPAARVARLYRYLAALKLDDRHALLLSREAAAKNKAAGNFRYCAGTKEA